MQTIDGRCIYVCSLRGSVWETLPFFSLNMPIISWEEYKETLPDSLKETARRRPYSTRKFMKFCGFKLLATVSYDTTRETALDAVKRIIIGKNDDLIVYRVRRGSRKSSNERMVDIFISL